MLSGYWPVRSVAAMVVAVLTYVHLVRVVGAVFERAPDLFGLAAVATVATAVAFNGF